MLSGYGSGESRMTLATIAVVIGIALGSLFMAGGAKPLQALAMIFGLCFLAWYFLW